MRRTLLAALAAAFAACTAFNGAPDPGGSAAGAPGQGGDAGSAAAGSTGTGGLAGSSPWPESGAAGAKGWPEAGDAADAPVDAPVEPSCTTQPYTKSTGQISGTADVCCDGNDQRLDLAKCGTGQNYSADPVDPNCAHTAEGANNGGSACVQITCGKLVCD